MAKKKIKKLKKETFIDEAELKPSISPSMISSTHPSVYPWPKESWWKRILNKLFFWLR